jgi:hypothetical protein
MHYIPVGPMIAGVVGVFVAADFPVWDLSCPYSDP